MQSEPLADFLANVLKHKGRGLHTAEMHFPVLDWLIASTLDADDRFVAVPGGKWELRALRDARNELAAREPEPVEGEEFAPQPSRYPVVSMRGEGVSE
jgi:hypothetical protein